MKLPRRTFLQLAAGAAVLPAISRMLWAQAYPARPVHIIFGLASGSAGDILARLIGQWLSERLGQPFVIENRVGAGGTLAAEAVVRSPPDGTRSSLAVHPTKSMRHSMISSILFFSAMSHRSLVLPVARMSWWCTHRFRPRQSPNLLPMPKPIRARSTSDRRALAPWPTWPPNCSRSWRESIWSMCLIVAWRLR